MATTTTSNQSKHQDNAIDGNQDHLNENEMRSLETTTVAATMTENTTVPAPIPKFPVEFVRRLINYNIEWPICKYANESKRNKQQRPIIGVKDLLMLIDNWHLHSEICIDGINGCGKSSMIANMKRFQLKINNINKSITCGPEYNYRPLKSLEYICMQQMITCPNSVWDRCAFSNLIFYYVHYLMYEYRNATIPTTFEDVLDTLNRLAIDTNLLQTINFILSIKNIPILFLINTNVNLTAAALIKRNTLNDVWNSKEYNYQMAQCHVYRYFAKILNAPLFDVATFVNERFNLGDMQAMITERVDIRTNMAKKPINDHTVAKFTQLPDTVSSNRVAELSQQLGLDNDLLVYSFSNK